MLRDVARMVAVGKMMQYLSRPLCDAEELIKKLGIKVSDETLKSVEVSIRSMDDGADSD